MPPEPVDPVAFEAAVRERRAAPETRDEAARTAKMRAAVAALPALADEEPGTSAAHWVRSRRALRRSILDDDPRVFLAWGVIRDTMFPLGPAHAYVDDELEALRADPEWESRWRPAVEEDPAGAPEPYAAHPESSANVVHHAYHLLRLEAATGRRVEELTGVVEFGGGYGALCRLAFRLGFAGRYAIYDLPEFSALQRWYLGGVGVSLAEGDGPGAAFLTNEEAFAAEAARAGGGSLFVAMWSLSETPLALRERLLPGDDRFGAYLFGYQAGFEGVDNLAYFEEFRARRPGVAWTALGPDPRSHNRYLIGARQDGA